MKRKNEGEIEDIKGRNMVGMTQNKKEPEYFKNKETLAVKWGH